MKHKKSYACTSCGAVYEKWTGKCSECGAWNTVEEIAASFSEGSGAQSARRAVLEVQPVKLGDVCVDADVRVTTGIPEFDLVLGGGLVRGSLVLVGGDPGIGKSTLLLQAAVQMKLPVLYASGEESLRQVRLRADRLRADRPGVQGGASASGFCSLGGEGLYLLSENRLEQILLAADSLHAEVIVIDSIQTMVTEASASAQGSVSQIREATAMLMRYAKNSGVSVFVVGHVTKSGSIAGPKILEHMVDTVLYFEGDFRKMYRVLRAVKNRFGSVSEIGVFEMTGSGLVDVPNPTALFLGEGGHAVVLPVIEGSRALLLEIQCLTSQSFLANPRRVGVGIDHGKMMLLTAVLEKKLGIPFYQHDIYLNVVGGFEVDEPAADLAIVASLLVSMKGISLSSGVVVMGEVGLTGEIRAIPLPDRRLNEAMKMGFQRAIIPMGNLRRGDLPRTGSMEVIGIEHVSELIPHLIRSF